MKTQTRSLTLMVEEQLTKWKFASMERKVVKTKPGPVITISREPGTGGSEIARRLADGLKMDLIGAQIIQKIAESADISEKVISSLDEKEVKRREDWLSFLFTSRSLWADEYLRHLTKVIGTFGKQGNFVIVGRGSQYILPPEDTFRLRFIADMETKIQNVMRDFGSSREESEEYINKTHETRHAYLRKHFNVDWTNPADYDMVINTGKLGIDGSVEAITAAFTSWKRKYDATP